MKNEIFLIFFISIISAAEIVENRGDIEGNSPYNNAKLQHGNLSKEMKEIDRQIEKTKTIKCYSPFEEIVAGILDLLPFSNFFKSIFICGDRKCEAQKQSQLARLVEKKKAKEEQISKAHEAIKELHPMQARILKEERVQDKPEVGIESKLMKEDNSLTPEVTKNQTMKP